jgi:uncharacterized protein YchJ
MERYDPLKAPDPQEWLSLDEQERIDLVADYHLRARIDLPNAKAHAVAHAIVENQIALGGELAAERTLHRLMAEGLDRHDAVHAIGFVLLGLLNDTMRGSASDEFSHEEYAAGLDRLTAAEWRQSGDESTPEEDTDATSILDDLVAAEGLPEEAITAARACQASMVPVFLEVIEAYLAADPRPPIEQGLFFIFHLLGEWREKSAYRPLARLLRLPADESDAVFGDTTTETSHRVMAAVFDGDPQPLYDVILDSAADQFIRSRMCEVLAMVTLRDEVPRAEAERFLRACYSDIEPKNECFVWNGWQSAIAALGLVALKPLVEQAFKRGSISSSWMGFEHFEEDLLRAIEHPAAPWQHADEYAPFVDTIEELSGWYSFSAKEASRRRDAGGPPAQWAPSVPGFNPFKGVGRNDRCPCGSGKKFKKCCLN